ncbi:cyclase family protein [Siminovitchia sediminis]|uniref:Cyclase family protein n=1 Tax=Siminovitchia sediminis TaxID=1274353 RepID=A0ABW4KKX8_9BACI
MKNKKEVLIDLSHTLETYGDNPYQQLGENARTLIGTFATYEANGFYECALYIGDHAGTHMDATKHFNPDGLYTDEVPLEAFYGEACILDLTHMKAHADVTIDDIQEAAAKAEVNLEDYHIVLLKTGRDKLYGTPEYFKDLLNILPETIEWMIQQGMVTLGVDMVTIELDRYIYDPDSDLEPNAPERYPAHCLMQKYEWYMIENMANLDKIPGSTCKFTGFPIKIGKGSGGPMRAVAIIEE